jgi:hypothetical protein
MEVVKEKRWVFEKVWKLRKRIIVSQTKYGSWNRKILGSEQRYKELL